MLKKWGGYMVAAIAGGAAAYMMHDKIRDMLVKFKLVK